MPRGGGHAIGPPKRRARLASRVRASSTNSSSPRLSQQAFTASDVVELYLHRGAFEPALADEDNEQDPDRWCSHSAWGQECWQLVSQWVWNLRLELGHQLEPTPLRVTEFAPAIPPVTEEVAASSAPVAGYGPPASENGSLLGTGLSSPARWDASLSSRAVASCP